MRSLGLCLALTSVLGCTVLSATSEPATAQDRAPQRLASQRTAWEPLVARSYSLRDIGFSTPINFAGIEMGQEIFFPVPDNIGLRSATIDIQGNFLRSEIGTSTLVASVNGQPTFLLEPKEREGDYSRIINVAPMISDRRGGFLSLGLKFSTNSAANSCEERRSIGNVIAVKPNSYFRYEAAAASVTDVRTAWRMLPQVTRVLVPKSELTPDEFRGALRAALAIATTGRKPEFATVPDIGDYVVSVGAVDGLPADIARLPQFQKFADAGARQRIESPAERAAFALMAAMRGQSAFGETVIGYAWLQDMIAKDIAELRTVAGPVAASLNLFFANVLESKDLQPGDNLKLAAIFGQPTIVFDSSNVSAAAGMLGSSWAEMAQAGGIDVGFAAEKGRTTDWMPLFQSGTNLDAAAVVDFNAWTSVLSTSQMPPGKWPTSVEIEARISPDETDVSPVLSITLNNVLLRAERVAQDGDIVRLRADVPQYLLSSSNRFQVAVQRGSRVGDCRTFARGYLAQILPTSRVIFSDFQIDDQFFGFKSRLAETAIVALPKAFLRSPKESLPFVYPFLQALGVTPTSLRLMPYDQPGEFSPFGSFVGFGLPAKGLQRDVQAANGQLRIQSLQAGEAIDLQRGGNLAVAYLTEYRNHAGVVINTVTGQPASDVKVEGLDVGDTAVFGPKGQVMLLGEEEYRITNLQSALLAPAAIISRYSIWIASGLLIVTLLITMSILRAVITRRRRARDMAAAAKSATAAPTT